MVAIYFEKEIVKRFLVDIKGIKKLSFCVFSLVVCYLHCSRGTEFGCLATKTKK